MSTAAPPQQRTLPLHPQWSSPQAYIDSLLTLVTTSDLLRNLCGGVHILDFLTREPDLYSWVLPAEWRSWLDLVDIHDFLDLLLREQLDRIAAANDSADFEERGRDWRGYPYPPQSLVDYIRTIRLHCLARTFEPISSDIEPLPRHISVGMKPKKIHEVQNFAAYVNDLSSTLSHDSTEALSIIDFGSGQNYLGRTLTCPPYNKDVIAIEQRHHNVEGAKGMDVRAGLAKKEKVMRNKKEYKRQMALMGVDKAPSSLLPDTPMRSGGSNTPVEPGLSTPVADSVSDAAEPTALNRGSMTYVEHALESGHLEHILKSKVPKIRSNDSTDLPKSLVVSIHSCGNLTHHGLRSIILNPSVQAVAMIGCCYNLLTERLGPMTYKHPQLRPNHPRLEATGSTYDPHGFPMSKRLEEFEYDVDTAEGIPKREKGVRLNITARMMAVQAPYNWGRDDSDRFFTRHFYRALFQRILMDRGVVKRSVSAGGESDSDSVINKTDAPLIIGTLPKTAFVSFQAYTRAALAKLTTGNPDARQGEAIARMTADLLTDHAATIVGRYEADYAYARKHLAVIWSLMAFSAAVVESVIVTDRWLWLTEQPEVEHAWVDAVFGYEESPRNLCVVGIKRREKDR